MSTLLWLLERAAYILGAWLAGGLLVAFGLGALIRRRDLQAPCAVCAHADAILDHHPELMPRVDA